LTVSIVAAVSAFVDEGLYLSDLDNNSRREMIRRMKDQIEFAASLDADVPIGVLRGSKGGSKYLRTLAESMIELYEFAEPLGVDLLLEPVNRYETEMINTVVEAFEFIERYDLPPFNLLPDLFHMNIEEADICAALKLAAGRIGHLHLADSNRRVPGMGHQPWDDIAETLAAIGYRGSYAFETIPGAEPFVDAQVGIFFIRNLFDKYSLVP
jgi:sugar phosphate isomerase/epimerase